jgi:hypothetical protein
MNRLIGHILRMIGLLIELIGVWVVFSPKADTDVTRIALPGGKTVPVGWLVVAVGFALWLTGRVMVSATAPAREKRSRTDGEPGWSGQVGDDSPKPGQINDGTESTRPINEIQP